NASSACSRWRASQWIRGSNARGRPRRVYSATIRSSGPLSTSSATIIVAGGRMFKFEIKGLDELREKLRQLQRNAEAVSGNHEVPFSELFPPEFMLLHTDFESMDAMIAASGFKVESQEDFAAIPDEPWDAFVRDHTRFDDWNDMKAAAAREYVSRRL